MTSGSRFFCHIIRTAVLAIALHTAACSADGLVGNTPLPPDVPDPGAIQTAAGAIAAYRGTLLQFRIAFGQQDESGSANGVGSYVDVSGLLSDELQANSVGAPFGYAAGAPMALDSRTLPEYQDPALESAAAYRRPYAALQRVRGQAEEARGLLRTYSGDSTRALIGHLYAVEAYAEIFLADLFCSGIPLSTVDYDSDYTYRSGASTSEVYEHSIVLFDSALALAADSARIVNLARVGKGRALLALGRYGEAAQAVGDVPGGYQYRALFGGMDGSFGGAGNANLNFAYVLPGDLWMATVADREGGHGLDYLTSGDPRTHATAMGANQWGTTIYYPDKYSPAGESAIVLADWVEARLIEAEAALQGGDASTWLAKLNGLRQTAITPALPDTTDPGAPDARIDLLFRERAFWLFLTGHRQGDLRRLVRHYGREPNAVYPSGTYPGGAGTYGVAVDAPIPAEERVYNPKFTGCLGRGN